MTQGENSKKEGSLRRMEERKKAKEGRKEGRNKKLERME